MFHSMISLSYKKFLFRKFLMTSMHVICGLGFPLNQKSLLRLSYKIRFKSAQNWENDYAAFTHTGFRDQKQNFNVNRCHIVKPGLALLFTQWFSFLVSLAKCQTSLCKRFDTKTLITLCIFFGIKVSRENSCRDRIGQELFSFACTFF